MNELRGRQPMKNEACESMADKKKYVRTILKEIKTDLILGIVNLKNPPGVNGNAPCHVFDKASVRHGNISNESN